MQHELPWQDPTRVAVQQAASRLLFDLGPRGAAAATGVSAGTLHKLSRYGVNPRPATIVAILRAACFREVIRRCSP